MLNICYCFIVCIPYTFALKNCTIPFAIAEWLKNNSGPCDIIKGHFILDKTATNLTSKIYSSFSTVRRIEGCIFIENYKGSKNLSFFSNLEEVICNKTDAKEAGLKDVIHVVAPYLDTMGFDSLVIVKGPGKIILSYEKGRQIGYSRIEMSWKNRAQLTRHCFSKNELLFLMKQPTFKGKMYQPCNISDPCQRLELFHKDYTFVDIPNNCDLFIGIICILGPYDQNSPIFNRLKNITHIIGQIEVAGTLWNDLDAFSNLQLVRHYELPRNFMSDCTNYVYESDFADTRGQYIRAGYSRFLKNYSLPSLSPTIALTFSDPLSQVPPFGLDENFGFQSAASDGICERFFQKFSCCKFLTVHHFENLDNPTNYPLTSLWIYETWIVKWILTAIGLVLIVRSLIVLLAYPVREHLPKFHYLLAPVLLIIALLQVESCIFDEQTYQSVGTSESNDDKDYILPGFSNKILLHPSFPILMKFLTAWKYASMLIVLCCYLDAVLFYGTRRFSRYFTGMVFFTSFVIFYWLYQQLNVVIRVQRPKYEVDTWHAERGLLSTFAYMPFVMHVDGIENFTKWAPETSTLPHEYDILDFYRDSGNWWEGESNPYHNPDDMHLEILGDAFPNYCFACDLAILISSALFRVLRLFRFIRPLDNFNILLLLYLQLSMSRIRAFILRDIIWSAANFPDSLPYSVPEWMCTMKWILFYGIDRHKDLQFYDDHQNEHAEAYGEFLRLLEKSPAIFIVYMSFYLWRFTTYHFYLGSALKLRTSRKNTLCERDE